MLLYSRSTDRKDASKTPGHVWDPTHDTSGIGIISKSASSTFLPALHLAYGACMLESTLKFPVFIHGLDGPVKFLAQSLGEEAFDWNIELLREDDR